jgi:Tfp pilus assembly protein PilO
MTGRDRLMLMALVAVALLVGGYLMVVSPEREKAAKASAEVASARQQLESAQAAADEATAARNRYTTAYASLVSLGPAVPASSETPALVYALDAATKSKDVEFSSITSGGSGGSSSSATSSSSAASASFTQMPFSFAFAGSFEGLYRLLAQLEGFTAQTSAGDLHVNGRLLTIDGIQLTSGSGSGGSKSESGGGLSVTVSATAYVLPPGQATPTGTAPASPSTSPAPSSAGGSTPAAAAVVKAGP